MEQRAIAFARDDSLTLGLGDIEGRMLIEAMVFAVENEPDRFFDIWIKGKLISRVVFMWTRGDYTGAIQLVATSQIDFDLPDRNASVESFMERALVACLK
jgi:hypothetical protein